jgi:GR25 family glycosyltransferase involved in LPS biosynthesis
MLAEGSRGTSLDIQVNPARFDLRSKRGEQKMKAYVITLWGHTYSEQCAARCIESAARHGVVVHRFDAVTANNARNVMRDRGLEWAWPNIEPDVCPKTKLKRHVYRTADPNARLGCAMSHYLLWEECYRRGEPILVLEHDAVFLRGLPELPEHFGAIMLNDPVGATPKGGWWKQQIAAKGPGVHRKTVVFDDGRPDGLAGNSAYIISPGAARACMAAYEALGVWPNDATLCRQLIDGLMEVYPFVTEARQTQSTSGGY